MKTYHKIESINYSSHDRIAGDGIIEIELSETFKPYLLNTTYCDNIIIWWDCQSTTYGGSMKLYAVDGDFQSKVKGWYDVDITKALKYISDNLA